jgi:hypothetical protein
MYNPTNKREPKAKELVSYQEEVVTHNIGGAAFMTTKPTLREEPSSILALIRTLLYRSPSTPLPGHVGLPPQRLPTSRNQSAKRPTDPW